MRAALGTRTNDRKRVFLASNPTLVSPWSKNGFRNERVVAKKPEQAVDQPTICHVNFASLFYWLSDA